jgi:SPP1 family predicted phage head-tail adaptor
MARSWLTSGELREQITIKQPASPTRQADGSLLPASATTIATPRAAIEFLSGDEVLRMGIQDGRAIIRIRIRYRPGITVDMFAELGSRVFHFVTVQDRDEARREIWITAEERLRA